MREYGFSLTLILSYNDNILSLYGRIRVSENPYSRIFYAVLNKAGSVFADGIFIRLLKINYLT